MNLILRVPLYLVFAGAILFNTSCGDDEQGSEPTTDSDSRDQHAGLGTLYTFDFDGWGFCMERSRVQSLFERFHSEHGYLDVYVSSHVRGEPYVFEGMIREYYENQTEQGREIIVEEQSIEVDGLLGSWFGSEYEVPQGNGNQVIIKRNYLCVIMAEELELMIDLSPNDYEPSQAKQFLQSFRFLKTSDIPPLPHIDLSYEGACAQDASGVD